MILAVRERQTFPWVFIARRIQFGTACKETITIVQLRGKAVAPAGLWLTLRFFQGLHRRCPSG